MRVNRADIVDAGLGISDTGFGAFIPVVLWAQRTVHAHSSDEGSLASPQADIGEEVGSRDVDRGVIGTRGSAM